MTVRFQNNLRQLDLVLYRLKRNFGLPMLVLQPIKNEYNLATGDITRDYRIIRVRRGIALPAKTARDFAYDLSYIAANKNFTYGGYFDRTNRTIIIERKDLPSDFEYHEDCHIIFQNRRWETVEFVKAEEDKGFVITIKEISSTSDDLIDIELNLLAQWQLNDNAESVSILNIINPMLMGTFVDPTGDPNSNAHSTDGQILGALNFDGIDDYIDVGDPGVSENQRYTISAWVDGVGGGTQSVYCENSLTTITQMCISIVDGFPTFSVTTDNGESESISGTTLVNDGNYHHVVGVRDGLTLSIYVDNVLEATVTSSGKFAISLETSVDLGTIGADRPLGVAEEFFEGNIDNVQLFVTALTENEIAGLFNNGSGTEETILTASLPPELVPVATGVGFDITDDTIGQWKLNDNAPNPAVINNINMFFNGTLSDGSANDTSDHAVVGKINGALSFDGVDDIITVGSGIDFGLSEFALSMWLNVPASESGDIINKLDSPLGAGFNLAYDDSLGVRSISLERSNPLGDDVAVVLDVTNDFILDAYTHIVVNFTASGTPQQVYVNNVLQSTVTAGSLTPSQDYVASSQSLVMMSSLSGELDNVVMVNRVLTSDEVAGLYNAGNGTEDLVLTVTTSVYDLEAETVGLWGFNDNADTDVVINGQNDLLNGVFTGLDGPYTTAGQTVLGKVGNTLDFNHFFAEHIVVPESIDNNFASGFGISFWWFHDTDVSSLPFLTQGTTALLDGPGFALGFKDTTTKVMTLQMSSGSMSVAVDIDTAEFELSDWNHFVVNFNPPGQASEVYLNNVLHTTIIGLGSLIASSSYVPVSDPLLVGPFNGTAANISANMDAIILVGRRITVGEVAGLYNNGLGSESLSG